MPPSWCAHPIRRDCDLTTAFVSVPKAIPSSMSPYDERPANGRRSHDVNTAARSSRRLVSFAMNVRIITCRQPEPTGDHTCAEVVLAAGRSLLTKRDSQLSGDRDRAGVIAMLEADAADRSQLEAMFHEGVALPDSTPRLPDQG